MRRSSDYNPRLDFIVKHTQFVKETITLLFPTEGEREVATPDGCDQDIRMYE